MKRCEAEMLLSVFLRSNIHGYEMSWFIADLIHGKHSPAKIESLHAIGITLVTGKTGIDIAFSANAYLPGSHGYKAQPLCQLLKYLPYAISGSDLKAFRLGGKVVRNGLRIPVSKIINLPAFARQMDLPLAPPDELFTPPQAAVTPLPEGRSLCVAEPKQPLAIPPQITIPGSRLIVERVMLHAETA